MSIFLFMIFWFFKNIRMLAAFACGESARLN